MMFNAYCIKDKKAGFFLTQIMIFDNDDVAKRGLYESYMNACDNNPHSPLASYPEDFELWRIGVFDTVSGEVNGEIEYICSASAFRKEG